jgi:hypothetical protein
MRGFHNGIAGSMLNAAQSTERSIVMHKWINILTRTGNLIHSFGLEYGVAMPFWLHDYEGQPITVYWSGGDTGVMDLIMPMVDEYVVMSYNTDPANAASRVLEQAKYATRQVSDGRKMPRVMGSVETARGVGRNVSYGDTPGKASKQIVLEDILAIEQPLRQHAAFGGMAIHHWAAWDALPP